MQPRFDIPTGLWGRSFQRVALHPSDRQHRPHHELLPAGDSRRRPRVQDGLPLAHGARPIDQSSRRQRLRAFPDSTPTCAAATASCNADLYRDGYTNYRLNTHGLYLQDTFTRNRLTLNVGFRWDRQTDVALAAIVPANPFIPDIMPALTFPGLDSGVVWNDFSPRLGVTYDLFGTGSRSRGRRTRLYFGQLAPGQLAGDLISIGPVSVAIPGTTSTATRSCRRTS